MERKNKTITAQESHRQEVTSCGEEWKDDGGERREQVGRGGGGVRAGLPLPPQSDFLSLLACRHTDRERCERHLQAALLTTPDADESTTTTTTTIGKHRCSIFEVRARLW